MSVELANRAKKFEVWMYSSNKKSYIGKGVVKNASGWVILIGDHYARKVVPILLN